MLYDLVVDLIGEVPIEFTFVYGLGTLVACIFGIILIFSPLILALKILKE